MSADFSLDARLAEGTRPVADLTLCRVLLARDARFPWLILVPGRAGLRELTDLDEAGATALMREIRHASRALSEAVSPDKLNVAALGNQVPQLHVHVIARFTGDAAWPGPVWGAGEASPYAPGAAETLTERLRVTLAPETPG